MALCHACQQEMLNAPGCTFQKLQFTPHRRRCGKKTPITLDRIKHGEGSRGCEDMARCPDCNVRRGQFHHPGCDQEQCPMCRGQAIGCNCSDRYTIADVLDDEEEPQNGSQRT